MVLCSCWLNGARVSKVKLKFALHEAKVAQRKVKFEFIVDVARREAKSYSVAVSTDKLTCRIITGTERKAIISKSFLESLASL